MISFRNDYSEGAHPAVLAALERTNLVSTPGYGCDEFCRAAAEKIKARFACPQADVHFMEWSKTHVHSTFHICWGAQAGLYYHYGIQKQPLPEKLFGVFRHTVEYKRSILFRGFDDSFYVPHSRHTTIRRADVEAVPALRILASSPEAGVYAVFTKGGRQIFIMIMRSPLSSLTSHGDCTRNAAWK